MQALFHPVNVPFIGASVETDIADADLVVFGAPHGTPYLDTDNQPYATAPDTLRCALKDDDACLTEPCSKHGTAVRIRGYATTCPSIQCS